MCKLRRKTTKARVHVLEVTRSSEENTAKRYKKKEGCDLDPGHKLINNRAPGPKT
jgi:hypothetical protein